MNYQDNKNIRPIEWLQLWYSNQCDGDWEHQYGIQLTTIDNPGWYLVVDLIYTPFQDLIIEIENFDVSETDWYGYKVQEGKFEGFGDPSKLEILIGKFKEIVEQHS
jgi:hypothetical protein